MEAVIEMLSPLTPDGGIMTTATRDNLKRLAIITKQLAPPSGAAVPYMQIRGGSSKGLFFKAEDLPADENERNKCLLLAMEGTTEGDPRQIDGLATNTKVEGLRFVANDL